MKIKRGRRRERLQWVGLGTRLYVSFLMEKKMIKILNEFLCISFESCTGLKSLGD